MVFPCGRRRAAARQDLRLKRFHNGRTCVGAASAASFCLPVVAGRAYGCSRPPKSGDALLTPHQPPPAGLPPAFPPGVVRHRPVLAAALPPPPAPDPPPPPPRPP